MEDLYSEDNGRKSIDPMVLFKIVLIQHIYGIPSLRRTLEEVKMNLGYRWFVGYPLHEAVPHFSTVSYHDGTVLGVGLQLIVQIKSICINYCYRKDELTTGTIFLIHTC